MEYNAFSKGKVIDFLGFDKTIGLLKETTNKIAELKNKM